MNAVQSFFAKYHAVPATNAGPDWRNATTAALIGWAEGDCQVWDRDATAHARIVDHMQDVGNELRRRAQRLFADILDTDMSDPRLMRLQAEYDRVMDAQIAVFERIGAGRKADLVKEILAEWKKGGAK